jgi:hypothetical protein
MKMHHLNAALLCFLTISLFGQTEKWGYKDNIKIWYETQLTPQGNTVWQDKMNSGRSVNSSNQPSKGDILNFNPCLNFNGIDNSLDIPIGQADMSEATFFIVYQADDTTTERTVWHFDGDKTPKMLVTTHRLAQFAPNEYINFIEQHKDKVQLSAYVRYTPKEEKMPSTQSLIIGKKPINPKLPITYFKGKIAELMVFDRLLDYETFLQVQSYFALKYGISLEQNYYNTEGVVVWDSQKNASYTANITGIGRDDMLGLYQKQSTNSDKPNLLSIGVEYIAPYNAKNTTHIDNNTTLIWGDNNQDLYFDNKDNLTYRPLNRKWLMTSYGQTVGLKTVLKFDTKQIRNIVLHGETYYLMIDRNSTNGFDDTKADIIKADSVDNEGYVYFKNVQWDSDGSGSDIFSIATQTPTQKQVWEDIKKGNLNKILLYPNPITDGHFTARIDLFQVGDIQVDIYDMLGKHISNQILRGSDFYIYQGKVNMANKYIVTIRAGKDMHTIKLIAP